MCVSEEPLQYVANQNIHVARHLYILEHGCDVKTIIYFEHGWETVYDNTYTVKVYYNFVFKTGRFWPFFGDQFSQRPYAVCVHLCEHIRKLGRNNRSHLRKKDSRKNFIAEYVLNKRSIHVYVNSSQKFTRCVLNLSFFIPSSNFC